MRVLHFTNIPFSIDQINSDSDNINTSGGWMAALLDFMSQNSEFVIASAAFSNVTNIQISRNERISCYTLPISGGLKICRDLVNDWRPDLIHIHGTENMFGLLNARSMVQYPTVISLQGLIGPSSKWYHFFGNRNLSEIVRMHRWFEILAMRGIFAKFLRLRKMVSRECEVISNNNFFMGRTEWDKAYIAAINPSALYFYAGELLRKAFWKKQWSLESIQRHRIIFTNAGHPRKGAELLFDAVKILKPDYPKIQVAIAGNISHRNGYGRYIRARLKELGASAVELGPLNASQMAEELAKSHVFVSPSFIDNSPNAICEGQLIGMPVISSYTGGVPSLIEDKKTGLFFPNGDVPMLVAKLREVFSNDDFARQLGSAAYDVARNRHDPDIILRDIKNIYEAIIRNNVCEG